jgi:hypothetical protein
LREWDAGGETSGGQEAFQFVDQFFAISCFTFPHDQHIPAQIFQFVHMFPVTNHIPIQFFIPVFGIARWSRSMGTPFVLMPETPMHKYNFLMLLKDNIRFSR